MSHRKAAMAVQQVSGEAEAALKNRETEVRFQIIAAFQNLGIPFPRWPDCVRSFHTNPQEQLTYHQRMTPLPFHAPEFDRLTQKPDEWKRTADEAWERHREAFLQQCDEWVRTGVDEAVSAGPKLRGRGERPGAGGITQSRGENTPIELRCEWAAQYLLRIPLKEIAGEVADVSTVGRCARAILRQAGWLSERKSVVAP